jgi:Acyl-CoA dehydrogenase, N-terminal domain
VLPVIGYWERAEFPWPLIESMGKLGIVGDGIEGYGCPPMSPIANGLISLELHRGDGSGRRTTVHQRNELTVPTAVHLNGGHTPTGTYVHE